MSLQIVREFTAVAPGQWFVETTARPRQQKPVLVPAQSAPTNADLQSAFNDLMRALAPAELTAITRDLRGRAIGRPKPKRHLDTSPAAVEEARRLFGI